MRRGMELGGSAVKNRQYFESGEYKSPTGMISAINVPNRPYGENRQKCQKFSDIG